ncbi:MAG: hypothetical protein Q9162_007755 [Coniocarpon cinnabarinum]
MYIRQEQLPKLKEYKYSGVDRSLLSKYVLKPFYSNVALNWFPLSMAPNLITLSGFGFVLVNLLTMFWYNPGLDRDCPTWVYLSYAIGLFLYQTFDAVDGSQARRTHQSGPLGELFDHGVDALNTTLETLLFASATNLGQGWKTILIMFGCSATFYVQTWDEYHTHTLYLGLVSGPVEGIMTLVIVYAATAFLGGGSFWQQSVAGTLGISKDTVGSYLYSKDWADSFIAFGALILIFNTTQSALNVLKARKERKENPTEALSGFLPLLALWIMVPVYLQLQPTILEHHMVPFIFYIGLINAYGVGQIIVAHLTKSEFPHHNVLLLPLAFGIVDSLGPWLQSNAGLGWPSLLGADYQISYVFMSLGIAIGVYGSLVVDVIVSICDYLDIWCLTIKHPYVEGQDAKSKTRAITGGEKIKQSETAEDIDGGPSMRLRSTSKKQQ